MFWWINSPDWWLCFNRTAGSIFPDSWLYLSGIYSYTLDGSAPTASSTLYVNPIPIAVSTTIRAIAIRDSLNNSAVMEAIYTINIPDTTFTNLDMLGAYLANQNANTVNNPIPIHIAMPNFAGAWLLKNAESL